MVTAIKILRFLFQAMLGIVGVLILFIFFSVKPIDRTPYRQQDFYSEMNQRLVDLDTLNIPAPEHGFTVGFAKRNITPAYPRAMAGSGLRKLKYESVHDSIYVRSIVISNGALKISLVSLDLLIVPPTVTALLTEKLPAIGFTLDNTYLSATHTHSSIGNWGKRLGGRIYSGPYDDSLVHFISDKIIESISLADENKVEANVKAGFIPINGILYNRLADEKGKIDSLMRVIEMTRSDGKKIVLTSFTGHPTCDKSSSLSISRDYPGVLVDKLEANGYDFAMFMAGAVGSHACDGPERGRPRIDFVGNLLATTLLQHDDSLKPVNDSLLSMIRLPLELGEPQMKLSKDWCVRPWLFKSAFGTYPSSLTALRIGNVIMLGTPCDFSGELTGPIDSVAAKNGMKAMVTSFNGSYIGYITLDKHYDIDHYETRIMNWYGPGNGAYLTECLLRMTDVLAKQ